MELLKTGLAGLEQVSAQLRNLPASHTWNFSEVGGSNGLHCGSSGCAVGLMRALWPEQCEPDIIGWKFVSDILKLPSDDIERLFGWNIEEDYYGKQYRDVTSIDVANAIDAYIAKHQPPLPTLAIIITVPQKAAREAL